VEGGDHGAGRPPPGCPARNEPKKDGSTGHPTAAPKHQRTLPRARQQIDGTNGWRLFAAKSTAKQRSKATRTALFRAIAPALSLRAVGDAQTRAEWRQNPTREQGGRGVEAGGQAAKRPPVCATVAASADFSGASPARRCDKEGGSGLTPAVRTPWSSSRAPQRREPSAASCRRIFVVEASMGHVRDLPNNASEIRRPTRGEKWAKPRPSHNQRLRTLYVECRRDKKKDLSRELRTLSRAPSVVLGCHRRRPGGGEHRWHLLPTPLAKVSRQADGLPRDHKEAIGRALDRPANSDMELVPCPGDPADPGSAGGYTSRHCSGRKVAWGLSAGRVQSVRCGWLVQRERPAGFRKRPLLGPQASCKARPAFGSQS